MKNHSKSYKRKSIHLDFTPMAALGLMLTVFFQINQMIQTPQVPPLSIEQDLDRMMT